MLKILLKISSNKCLNNPLLILTSILLENIFTFFLNDFLKKFNLFSFQHRLFYRLSLFAFKRKKIVNMLKTNTSRECTYTLSNEKNFKQIQTDLQEGKKTFQYFFYKSFKQLFYK